MTSPSPTSNTKILPSQACNRTNTKPKVYFCTILSKFPSHYLFAMFQLLFINAFIQYYLMMSVHSFKFSWKAAKRQTSHLHLPELVWFCLSTKMPPLFKKGFKGRPANTWISSPPPGKVKHWQNWHASRWRMGDSRNSRYECTKIVTGLEQPSHMEGHK